MCNKILFSTINRKLNEKFPSVQCETFHSQKLQQCQLKSILHFKTAVLFHFLIVNDMRSGINFYVHRKPGFGLMDDSFKSGKLPFAVMPSSNIKYAWRYSQAFYQSTLPCTLV